ncbi:MAG: tripartite tricarboxylate transporter TctB family protein, partial [Deltaproteobacteria bacterium]|nr:tripartite tricarboxylate transporter TctB family protein [Deltaproteobacteria bacterium]
KDRILGLVLFLGALAWMGMVYWTIPAIEGDLPGPDNFPLLLGTILALSGLALFSTTFFTRNNPSENERDTGISSREIRVVLGTFALILVYGFLMEKVGFVVATPLVLATALFFLARVRSWLRIGGISLGFTLISFLVFNVLLSTNLPRGSWLRLW